MSPFLFFLLTVSCIVIALFHIHGLYFFNCCYIINLFLKQKDTEQYTCSMYIQMMNKENKRYVCLKAVKLIWSTLLKKHVLFCFGFLSLSLFYFSETCFFSESQTPHDEEMLVSMFSAMQQKLAYREKEKKEQA